MNLVDPRPAHVGQGFNVHIACQKLRLEACHLAGGCSLSFNGFATNNPPHGGITAQTVGIVHVVVATKTAKEGLAELSRHAVPPVLAGAAIGENIPSGIGQLKGIIKLSIGEKPSVSGDLGTMKFQLQSAVKIDPQRELFAFTRWVTGGASVLRCVCH